MSTPCTYTLFKQDSNIRSIPADGGTLNISIFSKVLQVRIYEHKIMKTWSKRKYRCNVHANWSLNKLRTVGRIIWIECESWSKNMWKPRQGINKVEKCTDGIWKDPNLRQIKILLENHLHSGQQRITGNVVRQKQANLAHVEALV